VARRRAGAAGGLRAELIAAQADTVDEIVRVLGGVPEEGPGRDALDRARRRLVDLEAGRRVMVSAWEVGLTGRGPATLWLEPDGTLTPA
jgi:hypothetical protein